jgi:hypothetical protein
MIMTPDQIAMLRATDKVRGRVDDRIMYSVSVSIVTFVRICELSVLDSIPTDCTWYSAGSTTGRVELHTNNPEWFVTLEQRMDDARRQ